MTDQMGPPANAELEYLRGEVRRLQDLVARMSRARVAPYAAEVDPRQEPPAGQPWMHVQYRTEVIVPSWGQQISVRLALSEEMWTSPFGMEALDELISRANRMLGTEIRERREREGM